jgi:hypothetical protein
MLKRLNFPSRDRIAALAAVLALRTTPTHVSAEERAALATSRRGGPAR